MASAASRNSARPVLSGFADLFQHRTLRLRVGADAVETERGVALGLDVARACDARRDLAAALGRRRQDQIGGGHRRHVDMQIDAVEQRTGEAVLIIGDAARIRAALAHEARIVGAAAAAGIHRRDQHEARRIRDAMIGARDRDLAGLERLAQRIQNLRRGIPAARRERERRDARARFRPAARASRRRPAPACWRNDAARGTAGGW